MQLKFPEPMNFRSTKQLRATTNLLLFACVAVSPYVTVVHFSLEYFAQ